MISKLELVSFVLFKAFSLKNRAMFEFLPLQNGAKSQYFMSGFVVRGKSIHYHLAFQRVRLEQDETNKISSLGLRPVCPMYSKSPNYVISKLICVHLILNSIYIQYPYVHLHVFVFTPTSHKAFFFSRVPQKFMKLNGFVTKPCNNNKISCAK